MKQVILSFLKSTHRMALVDIEDDRDVNLYLAKHGDEEIPLASDDGVRNSTHEVVNVGGNKVNIPVYGKITKDGDLEVYPETAEPSAPIPIRK